MMNFIKLLISVSILALLLTACGAKKNRKTQPVQTNKTASKQLDVKKEDKNISNKVNKVRLKTIEYVKKYAPVAIAEMRKHKIPASITLAQGILESSSGNSTLTKQSNNHFGIKCHKNWTGSKTYYDDDKKGECFRVYSNPAQSFDDHSEFLTKRKRYQALFKLDPGDYKAWAKGLKKAGYATDPKYPDKLIHIIQKYRLYEYDDEVLGRGTSKHKAVVKPEYYIVKKGDGLYRISKKYRLSVSQLIRYNALTSDQIKVGQKLWLQPGHINSKPKDSVKTAVSSNIERKTIVQDTVTEKAPNDQRDINDTAVIKKDTISPTTKKIIDAIVVKKASDSVSSFKPKELTISKKDTTPPVIVIDTTTVSKKKNDTGKLPEYHIVKKGETLYMIAYKYDLEVPDLRKWNHIYKNEISIGQKLRLTNPKLLPKKNPADSEGHIVEKGETLYSISTKYKLSVNRLKALNHLKNNTIYIGQVLKVK